jgi:hypothetical protein
MLSYPVAGPVFISNVLPCSTPGTFLLRMLRRKIEGFPHFTYILTLIRSKNSATIFSSSSFSFVASKNNFTTRIPCMISRYPPSKLQKHHYRFISLMGLLCSIKKQHYNAPCFLTFKLGPCPILYRFKLLKLSLLVKKTPCGVLGRGDTFVRVESLGKGLVRSLLELNGMPIRLMESIHNSKAKKHQEGVKRYPSSHTAEFKHEYQDVRQRDK